MLGVFQSWGRVPAWKRGSLYNSPQISLSLSVLPKYSSFKHLRHSVLSITNESSKDVHKVPDWACKHALAVTSFYDSVRSSETIGHKRAHNSVDVLADCNTSMGISDEDVSKPSRDQDELFYYFWPRSSSFSCCFLIIKSYLHLVPTVSSIPPVSVFLASDVLKLTF